MRLTLTRDFQDAACTLGVLRGTGFELQTIERPWVPSEFGAGGRKGVSCVPPGLYRLTLHDSEAHPNSFALVNPALGVFHLPSDVIGSPEAEVRTAVLIHAANWAHELRGCIAPGKMRKLAGGVWMVTESRAAMRELYRYVAWEPGHQLLIKGIK